MALSFKFPHDESEGDFDALPEASRLGIINRGLAHIFGNEVASQVVGHVRGRIAGEDGKASEVSTEAIKAYREAHPDEMTAKTQEFQKAKHQAILEGKLGVRASGSGVSVDPMTKEMLRIAKDEIQAIFKKRGWAWPTKDTMFTANKDTPTEVTLDASGWTRRWLDVSNDKLAGGKGDPNRPRIEKLAQRNLQAKASLAKRVEDAQVGDDGDSGL
jgi:hypothetical protein